MKELGKRNNRTKTICSPNSFHMKNLIMVLTEIEYNALVVSGEIILPDEDIYTKTCTNTSTNTYITIVVRHPREKLQKKTQKTQEDETA